MSYQCKELTMETVVQFNLRNGSKTIRPLAEVYRPEIHGTEENFFDYIQGWLISGKAKVMENNLDPEAQIADQIAKELMTVQKGREVAEDREARKYYNEGSHGYYKKVGFPAKTLLHAQEMHQMFIKNFHLSMDQLGVEMEGKEILVTITNCPVKTYAKIERTYGVRRVTETVTDTVDKAANGLVNGADLAVNSVAVPVAKTAIGAGTKVVKSLVGCVAKIGGIAVGEITRNSKQCIQEIKADGYIAEASGEVMDSYHSIRRAINKRTCGSYGGQILE